jgi:hypothetical protein
MKIVQTFRGPFEWKTVEGENGHSPPMSKKRISDCIQTLFDWSILTATYGDRASGARKGRLHVSGVG